MSLTLPLDRANVFGRERLSQLFEGELPDGSPSSDVVGSWYQDVVEEMVAIIHAQWMRENTPGAVQGFFLSGPPGVGKTTLAKRVTHGLLRKGDEVGDDTDVHLGIIDGSEIARAKYGESELRVRDIFVGAQAEMENSGSRIVLLFDDVDAVLMARGSEHAKEWHFSQDSVFFHLVDDLDTSRVMLFLTTNRPDLVDDAVRDRFLQYHVDYPEPEVLRAAALQLARVRELSERAEQRLVSSLDALASSSRLRSFRDARRLVLQQEIAEILGKPSKAVFLDGESPGMSGVTDGVDGE